MITNETVRLAALALQSGKTSRALKLAVTALKVPSLSLADTGIAQMIRGTVLPIDGDEDLTHLLESAAEILSGEDAPALRRLGVMAAYNLACALAARHITPEGTLYGTLNVVSQAAVLAKDTGDEIERNERLASGIPNDTRWWGLAYFLAARCYTLMPGQMADGQDLALQSNIALRVVQPSTHLIERCMDINEAATQGYVARQLAPQVNLRELFYRFEGITL